MSVTVISALNEFLNLNLTIPLQNRYFLHFNKEETEAQRCQVPCPMSYH